MPAARVQLLVGFPGLAVGAGGVAASGSTGGDGALDRLHDALHDRVRAKQAAQRGPSAATDDSQSIIGREHCPPASRARAGARHG